MQFVKQVSGAARSGLGRCHRHISLRGAGYLAALAGDFVEGQAGLGVNGVPARESLPALDGDIDEARLELQRVGSAPDPLRRQGPAARTRPGRRATVQCTWSCRSASGLVLALATTPDFNARCRKGRDIAGAVTSDTDPALSHAHRNAPRHATASAGCRGSSVQARSGRHRRYPQRLRPAQTG
jgi:hypothetical protein